MLIYHRILSIYRHIILDFLLNGLYIPVVINTKGITMKLKKAFRLALTYTGQSEADFARTISVSKNYVSAVARGAVKNAPGMVNKIKEFTIPHLTSLRDELSQGIIIEDIK